MNVKIDCTSVPAFLAHGGAATQIHGTLEGLRANGVQADYAHWWDPASTPDLLHFFGIPSPQYLDFASGKNIPVVSTNLFTAACNRPYLRMSLQGAGWRVCESLHRIPIIGNFMAPSQPLALRRCSICVVGLEAESQVLQRTFRVAEERIRIVPLALDSEYFKPLPVIEKRNWLINTGTITPRKRSLELAQMAHEAQVPVCFVGKPYDRNSDYWLKFQSLIDGKWVHHVSHTENVAEMRALLASASGFVLYSDYENWCLSAHEAAACGLPLLLPGQPWSIERFGTQATYFRAGNQRVHAADLKSFHQAAPAMKAPAVGHHTWEQVGRQLVSIYQQALNEA